MCVHRVITFSLLLDADLGERPTPQQLQILRGHSEKLKTISEVAYQWEKLVFVMGLHELSGHREDQARHKWC